MTAQRWRERGVSPEGAKRRAHLGRTPHREATAELSAARDPRPVHPPDARRLDRLLGRVFTHLRAHVAELRQLESAGAIREELEERRGVVWQMQEHLALLVQATLADSRTERSPTPPEDPPHPRRMTPAAPRLEGNDMNATTDTVYTTRLDHTAALLRHFADLRDGTHGGVSSRPEKQALYTTAVGLLDRHARQALDEINADLLLRTGELTATGVSSSVSGELDAIWLLSWPEQRATGIDPILIRAYFGAGSPHPHLRGGTVGDWPLNVFNDQQAALELSTLRAIAAAEIHNLVLETGGDYRIIPALGGSACSH